MPVTSPDANFYADGSTPISIEDISAAMATSTQAAFSKRQVRSYKVADLVGLNAITGMVEGDIADRADINVIYRYDGTRWRSISAGLIPVIPAAVSGTGASVGLGGVVSLSASTSVSIDAFSTEFDNYRVMMGITSAVGNPILSLQFRTGGTNVATANYNFGGMYFDTNSMAYDTGTSGSAQTNIRIGYSYPTQITWTMEIAGAPLATTTAVSIDGMNTGARFSRFGSYGLPTMFNGFTLSAATSVSGTIRIYGYNNN